MRDPVVLPPEPWWAIVASVLGILLLLLVVLLPALSLWNKPKPRRRRPPWIG